MQKDEKLDNHAKASLGKLLESNSIREIITLIREDLTKLKARIKSIPESKIEKKQFWKDLGESIVRIIYLIEEIESQYDISSFMPVSYTILKQLEDSTRRKRPMIDIVDMEVSLLRQELWTIQHLIKNKDSMSKMINELDELDELEKKKDLDKFDRHIIWEKRKWTLVSYRSLIKENDKLSMRQIGNTVYLNITFSDYIRDINELIKKTNKNNQKTS